MITIFINIKRKIIGILFGIFRKKTYLIYVAPTEIFAKTNKQPLKINGELKILFAINDYNSLISSGYEFENYKISEDIESGLKKGGVLFCFFIEKRIAHTSWLALKSTNAVYDGIFYNMSMSDIGMIGPCHTIASYRGKGIYPHVLLEICKYLNDYKIKNVLINTSQNNVSSRSAIEKIGFKKTRKVNVIWLFGYKYILNNPQQKLMNQYAL